MAAKKSRTPPPHYSGRRVAALSAWVVGGALGCEGPERPPQSPPEPETPAFVGLTYALTAPHWEPADPPIRLVLDPGHGAPKNQGASSSFCQNEEDFTLALAEDVADVLQEIGGFEVELTRSGARQVPYATRALEADAFGAELFVSLHSDIRGEAIAWNPDPNGPSCVRADGGLGFSVLESDEGAPGPVADRELFADAVAASLVLAGFPPYDGAEYQGLYEARGLGVFLDRHALDKRIYLLRVPTMPAVLIETHNARNAEEAAAWEEPEVRHEFALALGRGATEAALALRRRAALPQAAK